MAQRYLRMNGEWQLVSGQDTSLSISTDGASGISDSAATLEGTAVLGSDLTSADLWFDWGLAGGDLPNSTAPTTRSSSGTFTAQISGLDPLTEYEFQAVGDDGSGNTTTGDIIAFTTAEAAAIPTDGLIHRWRMDEGSGSTAADSVGTADGTISGPTWASGDGIGGFYLDYAGGTDNTNPGPIFTSETALTVTGWFIVPGADNNYFASQPVGGSGTSGFYINSYNAGNAYTFGLGGTALASVGSRLDTSDRIGTWCMLTLRFDGDYAELVLDDIVRAQGAAGFTAPSWDATDFGIGNRSDSLDRANTEALDDMKVYNRYLTDTEVVDLYNATAGSYP